MLFLFQIYLPILEREREHKWEGQREGERELQADSTWGVGPDAGRDLTTLRSPEPKPRVRRSTDCTAQVPLAVLLCTLPNLSDRDTALHISILQRRILRLGVTSKVKVKI